MSTLREQATELAMEIRRCPCAALCPRCEAIRTRMRSLMRDAQPRFQTHTASGMGIMTPVKELLVLDGGRYPEIVGIDHPDARLIEAAPELLAACEKAATECEECHNGEQYDTGEPCVYCAYLRAAIAKAKP